MDTTARPWIAWAPVVVYMVAIFVQSSFPSPPGITGGFDWGDKALHLAGYGLLGFLAAGAALRTWPERSPGWVALVGFAIAAGYGGTDEIHQSFVPERSADVLDFVADAVGAALGASLRAGIAAALRARAAPR